MSLQKQIYLDKFVTIQHLQNKSKEMTALPKDIGIAGNQYKIGDVLIELKNFYNLVTIDENTKYYLIHTGPGNKFIIDYDNLLKVISVSINGKNYNPRWCNNKNIIYCIIDDKKINLAEYLTNNIGTKNFKYCMKNDNILDYRIDNISIITKNPNQYDPNKGKTIINPNTQPKSKLYNEPVKFYNDSEIKIIEEFSGKLIKTGKNANRTVNEYRLVEVIATKERYYEMFLGASDDNDNDNDTNTKFSFIFDIESLDKILKIEYEDIIIKRPVWLLASNHYIWVRPKDEQTMYLHRYLIDLKNGDNKTIDHINGNKLDNRLSNLRIATLSEQMMNRPNVKRKTTLNEILGIDNTNQPTEQTEKSINTDIPRLQFDSLLFITKGSSDGYEYFNVEILKARTQIKDIREKSCKSKLLTIKEKLSHAVCKRYFIILQNPIILESVIDNKKFNTLEDFKTYSGELITSILGKTYTIDTLLDYLNTKKIPKYRDPRLDLSTTIQPTTDTGNNTQTTSNTTEQISNTTEQISNTTEQTSRPIYTMDTKYSFMDRTNSITIPIDKVRTNNIRFTGIKNKNLNDAEKLCYGLMYRYYKLVEHENEINKTIYQNQPYLEGMTKNLNTTGKKTLTDLELEGKKFKSFNEFKKHTENIINDLIPNKVFTLETFATHIVDNANHKKISINNLPVLNSKYSILVSS
jgi:hypothetical protein